MQSYITISMKVSCSSSEDEAVRSMETTLRDFEHWMCSDRIMLNDDETKFIVTASRHLLEKAAVNTIRVGDSERVTAFVVVCKEERHRLINGLASYPLKSGTSHGVHFEAGLSKSLEDYMHQSHSVGVEPPANVSIFKADEDGASRVLWASNLDMSIPLSGHRPAERECARTGLIGPMQSAIPYPIPQPVLLLGRACSITAVRKLYKAFCETQVEWRHHHSTFSTRLLLGFEIYISSSGGLSLGKYSGTFLK
ncbi:unnamed protein product [Porites lobata]|uniref:Uncharacterized protein n=1 Tax=Porites lobata TaxID=104759 RepID=A0ABN8QZT2_9CNID|nr:unnamed protein product [Porites lobata]